MFNPLRNLGDKFALIRARTIERKGNYEGALKILENRNFHSRYGRVFSKFYRAKLLFVARKPEAKSEVVQLTASLGDLEGVKDETYFRAYAAYLSAVMDYDKELVRSAIDDLDRQNVIAFVRSCLSYFPAS